MQYSVGLGHVTRGQSWAENQGIRSAASAIAQEERAFTIATRSMILDAARRAR